MGKSQDAGSRAELVAYGTLRAAGRKIKKMPQNSNYDLLIDARWRVEVKCAPFRRARPGALLASANIHRHGILDESEIDFYLVRFEKIPGIKKSLFLLFEAPLGIKTLRMSLRGLLATAAPNFDLWHQLRSGRGRFAQTDAH